MTTVAVRKDTRVARPLRVLVPLIQEELQAGDSAGLDHYRRAGEMLNEARAQVAPFKWGVWLSKNFTLSRTTAGRYMRLANLDVAPSDGATLVEAIGEPQGKGEARRRVGAWAPIRDLTAKVDTTALAQERQHQEEEIRLHRKLAVDLVEAGYRALAIRLHPDKEGGSKAAMQRLHRVRDDLKSFASQRRFV